jgi:hypothetical protein
MASSTLPPRFKIFVPAEPGGKWNSTLRPSQIDLQEPANERGRQLRRPCAVLTYFACPIAQCAFENAISIAFVTGDEFLAETSPKNRNIHLTAAFALKAVDLACTFTAAALFLAHGSSPFRARAERKLGHRMLPNQGLIKTGYRHLGP